MHRRPGQRRLRGIPSLAVDFVTPSLCHFVTLPLSFAVQSLTRPRLPIRCVRTRGSARKNQRAGTADLAETAMPRKAAAKSGPALEPLSSFTDSDARANIMARTAASMAADKAQADEETRAIATRLEARLAPKRLLYDALERSVVTFATKHREGFDGKKSMTLAHCRLVWDTPDPKVKFLRPIPAVVAALKKHGLEEALLEKPSKEALEGILPKLSAERRGSLADIVCLEQPPDKLRIEFTEAQVSEAPTESA